MNHDELEDWSHRAAQALQECCDDAQAAAGNPDGEDQLRDIRALLQEHCDIIKGDDSWQAMLSRHPGGGDFEGRN